MSVDKFGLREDDGIIYPIRNYAINLDDLENVEGFNNSGRKDQLYCFQLNNKKVYVRKELPPGIDKFIENKPFNFIFEDNKYIAIPSKYEWEIDLKLNNTTYARVYATDEVRILNSGKIIGSFVSNSYSVLIKPPVLTFINNKYFIASENDKEVHFEFKSANKDAGEIIKDPPNGSTIIIEGIIHNTSVKRKEILSGLEMTAVIGLSGGYDFKIILLKENNEYKIKFVTIGVSITQVEKQRISLNSITIHDFYYISRIRLTTKPVSDYEIKFC